VSVFDSFAATSLAPFLTAGLGEPAVITPHGGDPKPVTIIIHRDKLQTRPTDNSTRLEYDVTIQVAMADYPGGMPNLGGDSVVYPKDKGGTVKAKRVIKALLGQTGGMWILGLS
jgi:hypothetical protein